MTALSRQMAETGQTELVALRSLRSRKLAQELDAMKRASVLRHVTRHPVDCTDAEVFPNIAAAQAHLATLSPERRAELNKDWTA